MVTIVNAPTLLAILSIVVKRRLQAGIVPELRVTKALAQHVQLNLRLESPPQPRSILYQIHIRQYIHDLKTNADPAGELRRCRLAEDENKMLREALAKLRLKGYID
jgi:hypothetical protein